LKRERHKPEKEPGVLKGGRGYMHKLLHVKISIKINQGKGRYPWPSPLDPSSA